MVTEGAPAPEFTLPADDGSHVSLRDLRGRKVVVYFYPKDLTSGCTAQACDLRDSQPSIVAEGAVILGISPDPVSTHEKFREKHGLNFRLLSDEAHEVADAYGVWKEKSMYGRKYWGIERSTFLIDEKGIVKEVWRKVRPKGHSDRVTEALSRMG